MTTSQQTLKEKLVELYSDMAELCLRPDSERSKQIREVFCIRHNLERTIWFGSPPRTETDDEYTHEPTTSASCSLPQAVQKRIDDEVKTSQVWSPSQARRLAK